MALSYGERAADAGDAGRRRARICWCWTSRSITWTCPHARSSKKRWPYSRAAYSRSCMTATLWTGSRPQSGTSKTARCTSTYTSRCCGKASAIGVIPDEDHSRTTQQRQDGVDHTRLCTSVTRCRQTGTAFWAVTTVWIAALLGHRTTGDFSRIPALDAPQ